MLEIKYKQIWNYFRASGESFMKQKSSVSVCLTILMIEALDHANIIKKLSWDQVEPFRVLETN